MKTPARLSIPLIAATATVGLLATSASAATTTVRRDNATGAVYSGAYQITNVGDLTFSASGFTASCSGADLRGTIQSNGTGSLDSASATGCTSSLGSATVSFLNLPYTDGQLTYGPSGGYDGALVFTDPDLAIRASFGLISCTYGLDASHPDLTFNARNPDNANNVTGEFEGVMDNASLGLKSGGFLCPTGVTANGLAQALGKVNPSNTTYTQTLYVTS
ncbi:hypothetical protein [Actinomadura sp. WMMB 499]|uniref:hypothetical protein n=1 Tax=Actinomadura sp. WMMB 499 TaxID=1219491 RepID=UPI0012449DC4|nr:hypothetical protein [Actinomadura sp. WMMB 499]QFG22617.1 hypothetical protein F7P10_17325 [Actinomadura sp. WMMB 499]